MLERWNDPKVKIFETSTTARKSHISEQLLVVSSAISDLSCRNGRNDKMTRFDRSCLRCSGCSGCSGELLRLVIELS
jgi:hypothetical protein